MFTDNIISSTVKLAGLVGSGVFGLSIASITNDPTTWVPGLERLGSFLLIAVFVIAVVVGLAKLIPAILAIAERTKDQFIVELKEERISREKGVEAMREMLAAHKNDLGAKLDEGNRITRDLVDQLRGRPCLLLRDHRNNDNR